MTPRFREELRLIFPLADALQMRLDARGKLGGSRISGEGEFWMGAGPLEIMLRPQVMASNVGKDYAAILVKIQKRLWAYLVYFKDNEALHFLIIDANAVGLTVGNSKVHDLHDPTKMFEELRPGTVKHYLRKGNSTSWVPVTHDLSLDERRSEPAKEESRAAGTPV
jgi:hypothetical protein